MEDFSIKYGGRAFQFTVIVNTNEDPSIIAKRLHDAAKGKDLNAVVVGAFSMSRDELMKVFASTKSAADKVVKA